MKRQIAYVPKGHYYPKDWIGWYEFAHDAAGIFLRKTEP